MNEKFDTVRMLIYSIVISANCEYTKNSAAHIFFD